MKRFYLYISLVILGCFFCSCNQDALEYEEPYDHDEVVFRASGIDVEVQTKATAVTESDLTTNGFIASCVTGSVGSDSAVWSNIAFSKSGSYWKGGKYWPTSDPTYRFYAVYPKSYSMTAAAAGATISASNAHDIVCAYASSSTYKSANTLTFNHIFARLGNVTVNVGSGYTISGITINIISKTGGTYNLRTGAWSSTTDGSVTNIANSTPGTKSNDIYLVPGTYTLTASWTATNSPYSHSFSGKTVDVTLVAGKTNNIICTLTGDGTEVEFGVSLTAWSNNAIDAGTVSLVDYPKAVGQFTINASGDKVGFAPGNLVITKASPVSNSEAGFFEHQWDVSSVSTVNTGDDVDQFAWVGASGSMSGYYGMIDFSYSQYSSSTHNDFFGSVASESLADDYGAIPSLISSCGEGWRVLSISEWSYLCQSRTKGGSCNGVANPRYTMAKINSDTSPVYGALIFPDGYSLETPTGVSWGTINSASAYTTICTSDGWSALETAGCVFLPQVGSQSISSYTCYFSSTSGQNTGYGSYFTGAQCFGFGYNNSYSYSQTKSMNNARCYRFPIRMVRDY